MLRFKTLVAAGLLATTLSADALFSYDMNDNFTRMNQVFNSMLTNSFHSFQDLETTKVNMYEKDNKYYIEYQVPGAKKEDLKLSLQNNVLKLETTKKVQKEETGKDYVKKEFSYGSEQRVVLLPSDAQTKELSTKYNNGLLTVTIPKKAQIKSKTNFIKIN